MAPDAMYLLVHGLSLDRSRAEVLALPPVRLWPVAGFSACGRTAELRQRLHLPIQ